MPCGCTYFLRRFLTLKFIPLTLLQVGHIIHDTCAGIHRHTISPYPVYPVVKSSLMAKCRQIRQTTLQNLWVCEQCSKHVFIIIVVGWELDSRNNNSINILASRTPYLIKKQGNLWLGKVIFQHQIWAGENPLQFPRWAKAFGWPKNAGFKRDIFFDHKIWRYPLFRQNHV